MTNTRGEEVDEYSSHNVDFANKIALQTFFKPRIKCEVDYARSHRPGPNGAVPGHTIIDPWSRPRQFLPRGRLARLYPPPRPKADRSLSSPDGAAGQARTRICGRHASQVHSFVRKGVTIAPCQNRKRKLPKKA
jgi:hypothetical protein